MKFQHLLSSTCLIVAALFLLSVSVHPAMAAQAINEQTNGCTGCSPQVNDLSSLPGFEGKKIPTITIREISPANSPGRTTAAATAATIAGTQRMQLNSAVTFDIQNPLGRTAAASAGLADAQTGTGYPGEIAGVIANMSRDGYDLTTESMHRYASTLTSDDFLTLNSSQKSALATAGFTLTSGDTVRSYRDVTYYTFTSRTTGTYVYLVAVQRLDANGNPVGDQDLALSPEFSGSGAWVAAAPSGASSPIRGSCAMEWIAVILAAIGLLVNIALIIIGTDGVYAPIILDAIALISAYIIHGNGLIGETGRAMADRFWAARPYIIAVAVITCIVLLIVLMYSIYKLGICMGWWDPVDEEKLVWSFQHRFLDTDNGKNVPVELHDRFSLGLFADTRADEKAHWNILSRSGGLRVVDTMSATTGNGTVQSWLVEASSPGPQQLVLEYVTSKPVPSTIASTGYTLTVTVSKNPWKIATVDSSPGKDGTGLYSSLAFDRAGLPHASYYDNKNHRIMYAQGTADGWTVEPVADTAGTSTTSLALTRSGNPAISFGNGLHYGNLMYAQKNGTHWDVSRITGGSAGDAGEYSSIAFDKSGLPHVAYNDGHTFASLKYAVSNGTAWEISLVDNNAVSGDTGYDASLVLEAGSRPAIAYREGKHYANLMFARQDDAGTWKIARVDDGGGLTGNTGYDPSLALDTRGIPHISYYDAKNQVLRYASWNGTAWTPETVDYVGNVGQYSSLALDPNDQPYISYYDASNTELRLATYDTARGKWVIRTVDTDGDVGAYSSLALDPAGHPGITYYDATRLALKYAGWTR